MLPKARTYEETIEAFKWEIPKRYNIAVDVCDKWADGSDRLALIQEDVQGGITRYTFDELKRLSNQFANVLARRGVQRGERVAIFVRQSVEAAIAHLAAYKSGCIAVPLFALFGTDAVEYRLAHSGATVLVTDAEGLRKIEDIRYALPALRHVFCVDKEPESFWASLEGVSSIYSPVDTACDDPAVIIYTSGTTGKPKGALHAHRVLLGHLPGVEMSQQCFPADATLMWTPADWAWIGGLLDVLLPSWHHGVAVLARRFEKFDALAAFDLLARHQVSHTFLPPTALRMMRAISDPYEGTLSLKSVASGGEPLGTDLLDWGRSVLGVTINEFYGQTECNMVVSSCERLFAPSAGAIGRAVPGHDVCIMGEDGALLPPGATGRIAVRAPDPVMFLGYWQDEAATAEKFDSDYLVTGDMGVSDANGFIRFLSRDDDVITSAGYRIGPAPIEQCLMRHPAVSRAAVVGAPDLRRTEKVCAFIVLSEGYLPNALLVTELQEHVRTRLAAHEYPREVHFVTDFPLTATGKVVRKALRASLVDT
jgi:acetyl-CoA synthetase